MIKKWLRRTVLAVAVLAVGIVIAGGVWWRLAGKTFLYGAIFPDGKLLLEGAEIPELSAELFRKDLAFLSAELPRLHVESDRAFPPDQFAARIAALSARADELSPAQRALELTGLLASGETGTGHTMVFPIQEALDWRMYPFAAYWFDDGLFVTAAGEGHDAGVGKRVVRVGDVPVAEALARLAPYVPSDNPSSLRGNLPRLLSMAEPMIALDLAGSAGALKLELADSSMLRFEPLSIASLRGLRWSRNVYAPAADARSPADPRPRALNYRLEYRGDAKMLVLEINTFDDQGDESLAELAERLDRTARSSEIERFVIDLRANEGGNNQLGRPLLETISDHPVLDRRGVLYVLVGRRTFSAAANFACALERRTRAIFAGETSGFAPNHYGDAVSILLPSSKVVLRLASRHWKEDLPGVERAALEPELAIGFSSRHHFGGKDPALAAISSHRPATLPDAGERLAAGALGSYALSPHHRVRLFTEGNRDRLAIDAAGPYAISDLHSAGDGRFETDIFSMTLEVPDNGDVPTLRWHGVVFALERLADDQRLPFELLRDGEAAAAVEAFRQAPGAGALGAHLELAINRLAYQALRAERTRDAVAAFRLNTELFAGSANTWDGLGDGLRRLGELEAARESYRRALERDPLHSFARRSLAELGG